ncbi:O-antigen ligase family protein [Butyrivibrio sp. AE2032]|uniref:O-antigen ligase family protein n=1 Tax=Butyrivibrio sp. AE2032 TaxID=1458463 RepID=UPI00055073B8|nr:O-antigen ligase family protein [Butyrivibrio sp. AE2032]
MPFITGIFYEWQAALAIAALLVILIAKTVKEKKICFETGFPLIFTACLTAGHILTAFWAVDKGMVWLGVVKFLPLLLFVFAASKEDDNLRFVPLAGVVMTVVSVALSPIDALKGHVIVSGRIGGFFEYPNAFAMFLLICLILVLFKEKIRIVDWVFAAVYLAGIALSGSRTVIVLTALTAIVFIAWVNDKKIKIIAAAAFVLAAAAAGIYLFNKLSSLTNGSTFYGRFLYFIDAMPVILKHPFGLGYYGYYYTQGSFQTGVYSVIHIHNDLLQILLDVGWIPAAAGCVMMVKAFMKAEFQYKVIMLMTVLHLLFDFDMQFVSMSVILLAVVIRSSNSKTKTLKLSYKTSLASLAAVSVVLAGVSVYFGLASFFNYLNRFDTAAKIYPAYTEAQKMNLVNAQTDEEMDAVAGSILKHNPNYPLANNAKARLAFSSGDILSMMDYKEKAISYDKYSLQEYLDYLDMLTYAISMYVQIEDYDSAEYCISRCLSIRNDLKRVEAGTSELGRMIDDKPELELPAEYADYIDMLQSMMGT